MSMARLISCLIALFGLAGCEEGPCSFEDEEPRSRQQGILLTGTPQRLTVMPFVKGGCETVDRAQRVTVFAEVSGPNLLPLPSEARVGAPGAPSVVEFTPEQPGPHHALVAFSPMGGVHQYALHAAVDHSAEVKPQQLPRDCSLLERTLHGTWVCNGAVLRGNAVQEQFEPLGTAVAGNVIWAVDGTSVRRFVDTGQELTLSASLPHSQGAPLFVLATDDDLVALHGSTLQRITFESQGVLASSGPSAWESDTALSNVYRRPGAFLLREGSWLAVVSHVRGPDQFEPSVLQLCPYRLVSGAFARASESCQTIPGELAGFEADVLWMEIRSFVSGSRASFLHRWVWEGGQLVEKGALVLGPELEIERHSLKRSSAVPVVMSSGFSPRRHALVTWSAERQQILLEYLGSDLYGAFASPTLLWDRPQDAVPRAYVRPPFP